MEPLSFKIQSTNNDDLIQEYKSFHSLPDEIIQHIFNIIMNEPRMQRGRNEPRNIVLFKNLRKVNVLFNKNYLKFACQLLNTGIPNTRVSGFDEKSLSSNLTAHGHLIKNLNLAHLISNTCCLPRLLQLLPNLKQLSLIHFQFFSEQINIEKAVMLYPLSNEKAELKPLSTSLESLRIYDNKGFGGDFAPNFIPFFPNLKEIAFSNCDFEKILWPKDEFLEKISFHQCKEIEDLKFLDNLLNLASFEMEGSYPLEFFDPLFNKLSLTSLNFSESEIQYDDLFLFSSLQNLKSFSLHTQLSNGETVNLAALSQLTNLENLDIGYIDLTGLDKISSLTYLKAMNLECVSFDAKDFCYLQNLTQLTSLGLSYNEELENLSYLNYSNFLPNLISIDLLSSGCEDQVVYELLKNNPQISTITLPKGYILSSKEEIEQFIRDYEASQEAAAEEIGEEVTLKRPYPDDDYRDNGDQPNLKKIRLNQ